MTAHHVLLVDDESVVRMTTTLILKKMGVEVTALDNGPDAIAYYRDNHSRIDLIIVDSHMPEMSGAELFHELKQINSQAKAVLASGFLDENEMKESEHEGFTAIINKPFRIQELQDLIGSL